MAKKNSAKRKAKKAKQRAERIRQEKHQRRVGGGGWDPVYRDEVDELPDFTSERLHRTIAWETSRRKFADDTELEHFLTIEMAGDSWRTHHQAMLAASVEEQALDLAFKAQETDNERTSDKLLKRALTLDPDCLEAVTLLSFHGAEFLPDTTLDGVMERYCQRPGVAAALAIQDGQAWSRVEARPVLRALSLRIEQARSQDDRDQQIRWLERLRTLDQGQYLGFRTLHATALLMSHRLEDARALLVRPREVPDPGWFWASILERFLAGDLDGAWHLVQEVRQWLPIEFEDLVLGAPPDSVGEEELLDELGPAWQFHPKALAWLREYCRLTTPEQGRQAKASYHPPVAALLHLGEPKNRIYGVAEALKSVPLSEADVPELLRLADDQALHELPGSDPACFGPVYALHALAELHPPSALPGLLALLPRRLYDDWVSMPLRDALARLGQPALTAVGGLLEDRTQPPRIREFAADVLEQLVLKNREFRDQVVDLMVRNLRYHAEQSLHLNGQLASSLAQLGAREATDLVAEAHAARSIDVEMYGTFAAWQQELAEAAG